MSNHFWDHHVIGVVSTNCYVFGDPKEAIMLDPGGEEAITIVQTLLQRGIEVKHIIASHGHFDHLGWASEVQNFVEGSKVYLHEDEKPVYEEFIGAMEVYGLPGVDLREPDIWVRDDQVIDLGGYKFRVMHTPGHSPGSATFLLEDVPTDRVDHIALQPHLSAFVGDTLFAGSVGRVDLPYSDQDAMISSLKLLIEQLKPQTYILPGHGPSSIMEKELHSNPFLRGLQQGRQIF